ncbi:adenylate/guanylate cyclase domain-containing protein [Alphaproteobacteria bacterium]|nr:adenylate/guanylate cyclase domain-containing protein [Alphaproteobacteria bacterium]
MLRWLKLVVPAGLLVLAVLLRFHDPVLLQEFRYRIFDNYQRLSPRIYTDMPVAVVDIDDETLARYGQWPWSRTVVADLVARLLNAGTAVVALDIVFAEPDRMSPENLLESFGDSETGRLIRTAIGAGELLNHDLIFADILAQGPTVGGFIPIARKTDPLPMIKGGLAHSGDDPKAFLRRYPGAIVNLPEIDAALSGGGSLSPVFDSDGVIRRVPLFVLVGDQIYPSLAAEALRVAQGASSMIIKSSGASGETAFGEQTGINQVKIGQFVVPTDAQAAMWLRDTGAVESRMLPAWKVMDGSVAPERLEGAIVFVGTSAAGLKDQHSTPLDQATTGVSLHAQMVEQILLNDFLERPDWADGVEMMFIVAMGVIMLGIFWVPKLGTTGASVISGVMVAGAIGFSWYAYTDLKLLFDPMYPSIVGVLVYSGTSFLRFLDTERERRRVRSAFSQYMSPTLVKRLAEQPGELTLGGEMRDLTLLFCDIRGFTSISERLDAHELTELINRFLTPMTQVIMESEGTIDKYMGDCIMAFWNAPLDVAEHRRLGVMSALEMRKRLVLLNSELAVEAAAKNEPPIELGIGIGLNSGMCCVGNVGSAQRFDYSALGDTVNLAARLEGQCKTYGVEVILSAGTMLGLEDMATLELDLIQVKGKTEPIRIFTVLGEPDLSESTAFKALEDVHRAMLEHYKAQDWARARDDIQRARKLSDEANLPMAGTYDLYAERVDDYEINAPGADWDGVYISLTK